MSAVELGLRRTARPARAEAWLIPGADPSAWFAAMSELGLAASEVRAFPLPRGRRDPRAAGLLLVCPPAASVSGHSARALAMRRIGQGLYVPVDAELVPSCNEGELDLLLAGRIGVLLPGVGFVAFTDADALGPVDMLEPPPRRATRWDRAAAGLAANEKLVAIDAERPPLEEVLLSEGRADIGTKPMQSLPAAPGEPPPKGRWKARLRRAIARPILSWTKRAPTTAKAPTWVKKLERFAMDLVHDDVLDERQRQLARLLALLDSDPEQGLLFALPLQGFGGRGLAPPGGTLKRRTPDYDSASLGQAAPVDPWDVDPRTRWELMNRYRRLANRELELGRARRAAYIFAELLGELASAAQALATGRHFLEAAELYRERLGDREAGARCLEQGGLLAEALAEWRALGRLERVAGLLERLGRADEARAVHRERVRLRLAARDRLGAAAILERELKQPEEAQLLLAQAWPDDPNLEACLEYYFTLLAQHGKHEEARRFVAERAESLPAPEVREPWLRVLAHLARNHADRPLRADAADAARVLVGRALGESGEASGRLLGVLGQSAPGDPLLRRDAARHAQELQAGLRARPQAKAPSRKARLEPDGEFQVNVGDPERCTVTSTSELLFVFTNDLHHDRPRLDAYAWRNGRCVATWDWTDEPALLARGLCQVVAAETKTLVLLVPSGSHGRLEPSERVVGHAGRFEAGTPESLPSRIRAMCAGTRGETWVAHEGEERELLLSRHDPSGGLLGTRMIHPEYPLDLDPDVFYVPWDPSSSVSLAAVGDSVFIGSGRHLWRVRGEVTEPFHLSNEQLLAAPPFTLERLVIASEQRLWLLLPDRIERLVPFGEGQAQHRAFLRGGLFVRVHSQGISVHRLGRDGAQELLDDRRPFLGERVIGLVPGELPNEFALIGDEGLVRRIRVLDAGE